MKQIRYFFMFSIMAASCSSITVENAIQQPKKSFSKVNMKIGSSDSEYPLRKIGAERNSVGMSVVFAGESEVLSFIYHHEADSVKFVQYSDAPQFDGEYQLQFPIDTFSVTIREISKDSSYFEGFLYVKTKCLPYYKDSAICYRTFEGEFGVEVGTEMNN